MNLPSFIFIFASSFLSKTSDPVSENVQGMWKGHYGTEYEIKDITIRIDMQNNAEIFATGKDAGTKIYATYKLLGDSAIIISGLFPNSKSTEIVLIGHLNRTASFISGDWDGSGSEKGCFYLQKQTGYK